MRIKILGVMALALCLFTASGCASYRTSSNIKVTAADAATSAERAIIIAEDSLPDRRHEEIGPIEVTVKKLTAFHKNPTREQADEALVERARAIGADAVIDVTYKNGVGLTTWGYIKATGTGVRFVD